MNILMMENFRAPFRSSKTMKKLLRKGKSSDCFSRSFQSEGNKMKQKKIPSFAPPLSINGSFNSMKIKMGQWNCRSLTWDKLNYINCKNLDIIFLQEIWQPQSFVLQQIPDEPLRKIRNSQRGGGSLLWPKNLSLRIHKVFPINKDCNLFRILIGRDKFLWISSIYLSRGNATEIKQLFKQIYAKIPSYEWKFILLAGDFNVNPNKNSSKRNLLESLTKQLKLQMKLTNSHPNDPMKLDFIIHGSALKANISAVNRSPSDHAFFEWDIEIPCPECRPMIKIPNRKLAEKITLGALESTSNSKEFLRMIQYSRKANPKGMTMTLKRNSFRKPVIQKLLDGNEEEDALDIIRNYFRQFNQDLEDRRFSNLSKVFFNYAKKVFKYDCIDKKDGSIISVIKDENNLIITDPSEVNKQLILTMKELQEDISKPTPRNLPFPILEDKTVEEMETFLKKLSSGKAISYDGITDSIFRKKFHKKSACIFRDLWKKLKEIPNIHFESRLIPLNKLHPQIPTRKDMRPIIITSPVIKLIESSLLPDLSQYLTEKLHPGQVGFVPGNGIFVNICRAIDRIQARTKFQRTCYGIFIDFSSAYNTINHQILFQKLNQILGETRTQMIQALYSRVKIKLGEETLKPNQGVAQGSIISPALFNIYSEGLLQKLETELNISKEDLLAYADDTLVLCDTLDQARDVIKCIRSWSLENCMNLNEKKSGIVEFVDRTMKLKLKDQTFQGFPICNEYRYLGLKLTNKLSMKNQLNFIWWKAKEIHKRLCPFLLNAELDSRKNFWQMFVQPLIEFVLPLYQCEPTKSNINKADSIIRGTFKLFTGLNSRTSNEIVDFLSGYNFKLRARLIYDISLKKWDFRKKGKQFCYKLLPKYIKQALNPDKPNACKRMPKEFITYLNTTKSLCPLCNVPNSFPHLKYTHGCDFPDCKFVINLTKSEREKKKPRKQSLMAVREILNPLLVGLRKYVSNLTAHTYFTI